MAAPTGLPSLKPTYNSKSGVKIIWVRYSTIYLLVILFFPTLRLKNRKHNSQSMKIHEENVISLQIRFAFQQRVFSNDLVFLNICCLEIGFADLSSFQEWEIQLRRDRAATHFCVRCWLTAVHSFEYLKYLRLQSSSESKTRAVYEPSRQYFENLTGFSIPH